MEKEFKPLIDFIKNNNIIQHGNFKLASGETSSFYLDGKKLTLSSQGLYLSSFLLGQELRKVTNFQAIGGPCDGAYPVVCGILMLSNLKGFMIRKEVKGHGTNKLIEGDVESGMDVAIVEDTVTTGGSAKKAIEKVREFGLNVKVVGSIFFRGTSNPFDVPFVYLFKVNEHGELI